MALGSSIALPTINVLVGNVWQLNPSRVCDGPGLWLERFPSAEGGWHAHILPQEQLAIIISFSEHPGENCFQVWVEVNLRGARTPSQLHWLTKLLKYDHREDFICTMLLCWDVTGFLPRSGRYGSARIHEISFPFPSLPVYLLFWEKEYRRKKEKKKVNQQTKDRDCFGINPKGWDGLKHD